MQHDTLRKFSSLTHKEQLKQSLLKGELRREPEVHLEPEVHSGDLSGGKHG